MYGKNITITSAFAISFDLSSSNVNIGDGTFFRRFCSIVSADDGKLIIGKTNFFNSGCSINCMKEIEIGNNNQFGEGVKMYDHNHKFSKNGELISEQGYSLGAIKIGNNCWFGSNVIILKGVDIGDNVIIGAGCIIHKSVPADTMVVNKQSLEFTQYRNRL